MEFLRNGDRDPNISVQGLVIHFHRIRSDSGGFKLIMRPIIFINL